MYCIIGVDESNEFTSSTFNPRVSGLANTTVGLMKDAHSRVLLIEVVEDLSSVIGGPVIHENDFKRRVRLD